MNEKDSNIKEQDIERIIDILDGKTKDEVSRIKVEVSDQLAEGSVREKHHHGRCDVGSVFANGMNNVGCE